MSSEKTPSQENNEKKPTPKELIRLKGQIDRGSDLENQESTQEKEEGIETKTTVESARGIFEHDLVHCLEEGDLHRWPEPREVEKIFRVTDDEETKYYVKVEGSDELHHIEKLKPLPELRQFKKRFGITPKELIAIEGFPDKPAERRWLLENLTQLTIGRIESEAERRKEKAVEAAIPDEWKKVGMEKQKEEAIKDSSEKEEEDTGSRLKNLWRFIKDGSDKVKNKAKIISKTTWEKTKSEHHEAAFKREIIAEIKDGGIAEHGDVLKQLIDNLNQSDFAVEIDEETNELSFDFVEIPDDATETEREVITKYNEAATEMARTPDEWQYDSAKISQKRQYKKVEEAYNTAAQALIDLKLKQDDFYGDELKVANYINEMDFGVRMNQLLNTRPDVEDELNRLAEDPIWWQSMKNTFKKQGLNAFVTAGGFATRWATSAATLGFASGAAALGVGAIRGNLRANRKLRAQEGAARYGGIENISGVEDLVTIQQKIDDLNERLEDEDGKDKKKELRGERDDALTTRAKLLERGDIRQKLYEVGALVNADGLIERLERDIGLVEDCEPDSERQKNRLTSLTARIKYTLNKLDNGVVNFGSSTSEAAYAKLRLSRLLSKAQITSQSYSDDWPDKVFSEWQERVGDRDEKEMKQARRKMKNKEMIKAAGVSGTFFTTGYGLRWFGEAFGLWGNVGTGNGAETTVGKGAEGAGLGGTPAGVDSTASETGSGLLGGDPLAEADSANAVLGGEADGGRAMGNPPAIEADSGKVAWNSPAAEAEKNVRLGGEAQENIAASDSSATVPADSTVAENQVRLGGDSPQIESGAAAAVGPENVPTPPEASTIGMEEIVIDENGEGMIHAIADKLEDKYQISHEKAMKIGNQLFVKGEQIGGQEELYNLVGKGSSFSLDFGDLTAADLEKQSVSDLVKDINFSQETFEAGESGIKGLELQESESDRAAESRYDKENSIERVKNIEVVSVSENDTMSPTELVDWRQGLEDEGIVVTEDSAAKSEASATEGSTTDDGYINSDSPESLPGSEAVEPSGGSGEEVIPAEKVNAVSPSSLRQRVTHAYALLLANADFVNVPENQLAGLENYIDAHSGQTTAEIVQIMAEDQPGFLTVLERVLTADEKGGLVGEDFIGVRDFVYQQASQLTADDFPGGLPDYARDSIAASRTAVEK